MNLYHYRINSKAPTLTILMQKGKMIKYASPKSLDAYFIKLNRKVFLNDHPNKLIILLYSSNYQT